MSGGWETGTQLPRVLECRRMVIFCSGCVMGHSMGVDECPIRSGVCTLKPPGRRGEWRRSAAQCMTRAGLCRRITSTGSAFQLCAGTPRTACAHCTVVGHNLCPGCFCRSARPSRIDCTLLHSTDGSLKDGFHVLAFLLKCWQFLVPDGSKNIFTNPSKNRH